MNRSVRIRMQGGVGRAGEKPALTRLEGSPNYSNSIHRSLFFSSFFLNFTDKPININ